MRIAQLSSAGQFRQKKGDLLHHYGRKYALGSRFISTHKELAHFCNVPPFCYIIQSSLFHHYKEKESKCICPGCQEKAVGVTLFGRSY